MVYLSANGEVIGQFEEREVPSLLAAGRVGPDAFFWREGMPAWRPLRELVLPPRPQRVAPPPVPPAAPAPGGANVPAAASADPAAKPVRPAIAQKAPFVPRAKHPAVSAPDAEEPANSPVKTGQTVALPKPATPVRKIFLPRKKDAISPAATTAPPATAAKPDEAPAVGPEKKPAPVGGRISLPSARQEILPAVKPPERPAPVPSAGQKSALEEARKDAPLVLKPVKSPEADKKAGERVAPPAPVAKNTTEPARQASPPAGQPAESAALGTAAARDRGPRGRKGLLVTCLLLLLGAAGALVWWFFPPQPPSLQGEIRLAGADGAPAPVAGADVLLVSQEQLAAHWRDRLAAAQTRAGEVEEQLKQANALHREKYLAFELAARTSELGEEYNMPDAAELRAARDAAQAEEATALAEVEKLTREKASITGLAALLLPPPEALDQTQADASGSFRLVLPPDREGLVVLVLAGAGAEDASAVQGWLVPLDGAEERTEPARLSADNSLDLDQIRELAGSPP